jgi:hypothetical protein
MKCKYILILFENMCRAFIVKIQSRIIEIEWGRIVENTTKMEKKDA